MKKTVWVDLDTRDVYSCKEQLMKVLKEKNPWLEFASWLDRHYYASDVWDASTEMKTAIEQEYQELCDAVFAEFLSDYYEAIEIEV